MLAWRLLLATGETRFADLIERTLYNVVATSPAPDGRHFFYANPLHQRVPGPCRARRESKRAASSLREPWFLVACCPTNVAPDTRQPRAPTSPPPTTTGIQIHQYASTAGSPHHLADGRRVVIEVVTKLPGKADGEDLGPGETTDGVLMVLT